MRIVLFNWRDPLHPAAGGAEEYTHELLCALARAGHQCTWIASAVPNRPAVERLREYTVLRMGNELTCRFHGAWWLFRNRRNVDLVIDEVNTLPFLSTLVVPRKTKVLIHQLAREVWWYEAPAPLAALGYVLEPLMLQVYRSTPAITISKSSAGSLRAIGLRGPIEVIESPALPPIEPKDKRAPVPSRLGYVGRITASKRIDHIIRAFALVLATHPRAELWIVGRGSSATIRSLKELAERLGCAQHVRFTGFLPQSERDAAVSSFECLVMASVREGWGLVVSEAARFGVPTVAYDTYGICDAVVDGTTGLLVRPHRPDALADAIGRVLSQPRLRASLGMAAAENLARLSHGGFGRKVRARLTGAFDNAC